jgi:hypothetical protein
MAPLLSRPARTQSLGLIKNLVSNIRETTQNVVSDVKAKADTVRESVATQGIRGTLSVSSFPSNPQIHRCLAGRPSAATPPLRAGGGAAWTGHH